MSQRIQYGKTNGKKIVLQMDISGKANQEQLYALLASVGSDDENDLVNLIGENDTEFIPVTEEAREALITSESITEVEDTTSNTGVEQRPSLEMKNLGAVVHDTIADLSPVSSPTSSRICISNSMNKRIRKRELFHQKDLTDRDLNEHTPKPEAKKRKIQLKRPQSSAVNDQKVHNKNTSCTPRLKPKITETEAIQSADDNKKKMLSLKSKTPKSAIKHKKDVVKTLTWKTGKVAMKSQKGKMKIKNGTAKDELSFTFPGIVPENIAEFFYMYADFADLCKLISIESCRYALQHGRKFICTPREIEVFFGVMFYMGVVVLPCYRDYWSTDDIGQLFVREALSPQRFDAILRNLHFTDNTHENQKIDKAWKVRSLVDHFNYVYDRYAEVVKNQCIDEHMCMFKGNNTMKQCIKNKPIKWGFKYWQRCCAKTGYLFEYQLYTGRKNSPELGLGEGVVVSLCSKLRNSYVTVYADNYFSSPALAIKLLEEGIYFTGVTRVDRVGLPKFKLDKEMDRGEYQTFYCQEKPMNAVKWIDNKAVVILTTKSPCDEEIEVLQRKKGEAEKIKVKCPAVIADYNKHMGDVDLHDRLNISFQVDRRSKLRFYLRLAFDQIDQCVVNSRIAYNTVFPNCKMSSKDYRVQLARGVVAGLSSRQRAVSVNMQRNRSIHTKATDDHTNGELLGQGKHLPIWTETRWVTILSDVHKSCSFTKLLQCNMI